MEEEQLKEYFNNGKGIYIIDDPFFKWYEMVYKTLNNFKNIHENNVREKRWNIEDKVDKKELIFVDEIKIMYINNNDNNVFEDILKENALERFFYKYSFWSNYTYNQLEKMNINGLYPDQISKKIKRKIEREKHFENQIKIKEIKIKITDEHDIIMYMTNYEIPNEFIFKNNKRFCTIFTFFVIKYPLNLGVNIRLKCENDQYILVSIFNKKNKSILYLNNFIGNDDGNFIWNGKNFSHGSKKLRLEDMILYGELKKRNGEYVESNIDLKENIIINTQNGELKLIL